MAGKMRILSAYVADLVGLDQGYVMVFSAKELAWMVAKRFLAQIFAWMPSFDWGRLAKISRRCRRGLGSYISKFVKRVVA